MKWLSHCDFLSTKKIKDGNMETSEQPREEMK